MQALQEVAELAPEPVHAAPAAMPPARLLIHGGAPAATARGPLAWLASACRAAAGRRRCRDAAGPTGLRIDDLQGRRHYACDDARATIDVPLPAGTYHVTLLQGDLQRRYTVALRHGATFVLRLPEGARQR